MAESKFYTPLKIGLFTVVLAYFLFALHDTFTLSWVGEWNRIGGAHHFLMDIFVEDIVGFVGVVFRFAAGIIAFAAIVYYFAKKNFSKPALFKVARWVVVFEGIYWFTLLPTGLYEVQDLFFTKSFSHHTLTSVLSSFATNGLPVLVESLAIPAVLFVLAYKLNPNKPFKGVIQWGLIGGTVYIFVFWLLNLTMWVTTTNIKGTIYLTSYPQNLLSYVLTAFGMLALAIFTAGFAVKSRRAETMEELSLKIVGVIILALGLYYLWNYLTWICFGGWSTWYAWFLGHNEDLWILSLPLLGLPLLFAAKPKEKNASK